MTVFTPWLSVLQNDIAEQRPSSILNPLSPVPPPAKQADSATSANAPDHFVAIILLLFFCAPLQKLKRKRSHWPANEKGRLIGLSGVIPVYPFHRLSLQQLKFALLNAGGITPIKTLVRFSNVFHLLVPEFQRFNINRGS